MVIAVECADKEDDIIIYIPLSAAVIIARISLLSKCWAKVCYNKNKLFLNLKKLISNFLTKIGSPEVFRNVDSKDLLIIFNEFTTLKESFNLLL